MTALPNDSLRPKSRRKVNRDEDILSARLRAYYTRWKADETRWRASDRRGAKLFNDDMWADGITSGRLAITANTTKALYERLLSLITRSAPVPMVESIAEDNDEAARVLTGALTTNWRNQRMQQLLKIGGRLCGFTRAIGWYTYWDQELNGGIGDFSTRIIPAHRLIVDDRHARIRDMEYAGFFEPMSRAKLMMLFPDKADEIEAAAYSSDHRALGQENPLKPNGERTSPHATDRLVNDAQNGPYTPVTSINTGRRPNTDPLADEVDVHFLWVNDPTPKRSMKPDFDHTGRPQFDIERDELGNVLFDHRGDDVVQTPFGPLYQPRLEPRMKMRMKEVIEKKYKHRRHLVWIPQDRVFLWDCAWNGPTPLAVQRDTLPIYGFRQKGKALSCASLAIARNVLWTIIFERLKLSLGGTWMATPGSGLRKNKLVPEPGVVFTVNNLDAVREFPITPLDSAYFQLLDKIENEMMNLLGLSPTQMGQAAGRADSPQTYQTLLEAGGTVAVDQGQLLEETIRDWAEIGLWFVQNYYTHEHMVEVEYDDGTTGYAAASALAAAGTFAVSIEPGSTLLTDRSHELAEAKDAAALGFYALPMLGKMGRIKHWRSALKQKAAIMRDPSKAWLLGAAGGTPTQAQTTIRAQGRRSHHVPGGK